MWSTTAIGVLIIVIQLVLPCYLAYDVWRTTDATRWAWALRTAAAAAFIALLVVTGRWDIVGYYLRFLFLALFAIAALSGYLHMRDAPWRIDGRPGPAISLFSSGVSLLLFAGMLVYAVRGFWYDDAPVRLASPLRGGAFYVGQGGDSPLINYHNSHLTQRYAMDILELNDSGTRAGAMYSADLQRYVIFGQPVHSPCDATVVAAVDGLEDNIPPRSDRDTPTGNHVEIACHGVHVVLAHLQRGSVSVEPGAAIAQGEIVGHVGNSGNTSEPHLHIHAVRSSADGTQRPVPILLDGRFAVRNTVLDGAE